MTSAVQSTQRPLDLPRELRDAVYEVVVLQQPITIKLELPEVKLNHRFASSADDMLACKQMLEEYMETVNKVTLSPHYKNVVILVEVLDMDFRKLIIFACSLATTERSALSKRLTITLTFKTKLDDSSPSGIKLDAWLQACSDFGVLAEYKFDKK